MNTERLHSLVHYLTQANEKRNFAGLLQQYITYYTQSVQSPNPAHATSLNNVKNEINLIADEFPQRHLSPSRLKILERIGGSVFYGEGLKLKIEEIIDNSKNPSSTISQLQDLLTNAQKFFPVIKAIDENLSQLQINFEEVAKDTAEVEVVIPNTLVDDQLDEFIKEVGYLKSVFQDIQETVTKDRKSINIRGLGSGSFEIYITVDLVTGAAIITFVTTVVQLINSILITRNNRESLRKQEIPDKILKEIKKWEEQKIQEGIDKYRDELIDNYPGDDSRKNELKNALSISLKRLADRIDRGMDIDIVVNNDFKNEEPSTISKSLEKAHTDALKTINENTNCIQKLKRTENSVLQLEMKED